MWLVAILFSILTILIPTKSVHAQINPTAPTVDYAQIVACASEDSLTPECEALLNNLLDDIQPILEDGLDEADVDIEAVLKKAVSEGYIDQDMADQALEQINNGEVFEALKNAETVSDLKVVTKTNVQVQRVTSSSEVELRNKFQTHTPNINKHLIELEGKITKVGNQIDEAASNDLDTSKARIYYDAALKHLKLAKGHLDNSSTSDFVPRQEVMAIGSEMKEAIRAVRNSVKSLKILYNEQPWT